MRILIALGPLAGLALVLWYKLLKPYDRMLALSQEVEKMRDWPREYHRTEDPAYLESAIATSLENLAIATSCEDQSCSPEQAEESRPTL